MNELYLHTELSTFAPPPADDSISDQPAIEPAVIIGKHVPTLDDLTIFNGLARRFARQGHLDDTQLARMEAAANHRPVDAGLESELRIIGASQITCAAIIKERELARRELVDVLLRYAQTNRLDRDLHIITSTIRQDWRFVPAELVQAFGLKSPDVFRLADAVERKAAPKKPTSRW